MRLEHVNVTVTDPKSVAGVLTELFGWTVRWEGEAMNKGYTVHVGEKDTYLALYTPNASLTEAGDPHGVQSGLNHIGIVVDDIDEIEKKVISLGYKPHMHADYEPGVRFYFDGPEGIEIEVVSYA